ncbi:MAG: tRNA pseudouridine(38-40) synthase TruA [Firmicutes bacterium]|nr:tRNA pseudouridine(38-40) synthase TruA [Bacillota bacterium]
MRNIRITIQYDGSSYQGFQVQGEAPTIQRAIQDALEVIVGERVPVTGAGRTDAGVHALGQVINFRTASSIPVDRFPHALNSVLPDDIVVVAAAEVPAGFHARYSATSKVYTYTFWNGPFPSPFYRRYSLWVPQSIDVEAMKAVAAEFVGTHDFVAFRSTGSSAVTTRRTVLRSTVDEHPALEPARGGGANGGPGEDGGVAPGSGGTHVSHRIVVFTVEADGFLYNMVRVMAGTLLEAGLGKRSAEDVRRALFSGERRLAGPTLPPQGLCLEDVRYGPLEGRRRTRAGAAR